MHQNSISFAGAGRVASALSKAFFQAGMRIDLIVSETEFSGRSLADKCNAEWSRELTFTQSTGIILVAVPDQKLENVLQNIECSPGTLIAHTAGSFGLEIFPSRILRKGVFYPLQTFSKGRNLNLNGLPFLIEASDSYSTDTLGSLAESLCGKTYFFDAEQRRRVHLAAVFVCNFINHMLALGKEISIRSGFPFEIFNPLISETISKALDAGPENSQTGPAIRNDLNTIEKHLDLLSFSPDLQKVYADLTESIISYYKNR